jgi:hypothetical protein
VPGQAEWNGIGATFEGAGPTAVELRGASNFYIGRHVALGFNGPDRAPEIARYTTVAALGSDGTFNATVDGRYAGQSTLFARACEGTSCAYTTLALPPGDPPPVGPGAPILKSDNVKQVTRIPYTGGTEIDFDGDRYIYAGQWTGTLGRNELPMQGGVRVVDLRAPLSNGGTGPTVVGLLDCPGTDNYVRYLDPDVYRAAGEIHRRFVAVAFHGNTCARALLKDDPNTTAWGADFNGVATVDVTDPVHPRMVSAVGHDSAHTLKPHPTKPYIYVLPGGTANGTAEGNRRRVSPTGIVDASNPTSLRYVRAFEHNVAGCHDLGFSHDGRWAFCAGLGGVETWDVEDPENPVVVGRIANPAIEFAHNAVVSPDGSLLLINDEAFGFHTCSGTAADVYGSLWIYDIRDPRAPILAGRIAPPKHPTLDYQVYDWPASWCTAHDYNFVPGTTIVVSSWFAGGTTVHDIADPTNPNLLAYYQPSDGVAWSAQYFGGYVVISDMIRGLEIIEIDGLSQAEARAARTSVAAAPAARIDRTPQAVPTMLPPRPARSEIYDPARSYFCAVPGTRNSMNEVDTLPSNGSRGRIREIRSEA